MKLNLLTQNLHCFAEENIPKNQQLLADTIIENNVDIIFLQEVAQMPTKDLSLQEDNYALKVQQYLKKQGFDYQLYYVPIKRSFSIYEEGIAMLTKKPLKQVSSRFISNIQDYEDWKTRKVLTGILELEGKEILLATTHFGWTDLKEVFEEQFDAATKEFQNVDLAILAGDYNITPTAKEYDYIAEQGWQDVMSQDYELVIHPTFRGDQMTHDHPVRLDYIMTNKPVKLAYGKVLFIEERISDHYGILASIDIEE